MAIIAIIPAAGTGSRMQAGVNKQYLLLAGLPILAHTIALFEQSPRIDRIVIVSPQSEIAFCRDEIVALYRPSKVSAIIPGGATRQESVGNALAACNAKGNDLIVIHDGVRPCLDMDSLDRILDAALLYSAATLGVPVKDTITKVVEGVIVETPERGYLWQVQTPQAFRYSLIQNAHNQARIDNFAATDDAMLVERCHHPVRMVMGNYRNIKITTPEDLLIAATFFPTKEI